MENVATSTPMATVQTRHPELLDAEGHICAFFHSLDEEYQVLLPFIREGLSRGERIFYIVDPELRAHHLARLSEPSGKAGAISRPLIDKAGGIMKKDPGRRRLRARR